MFTIEETNLEQLIVFMILEITQITQLLTAGQSILGILTFRMS